MKKLIFILITLIFIAYSSPSYAQSLFSSLPFNWVDNTICDPPSGVYDTTIILGTSINNGPNATGGSPETIGNPYQATYVGLLDAMNNWRDNGSNTPNTHTASYTDAWWLIQVPAQSTGTVLHGATFDSNNSLISLPGKLATPGGAEPSKCLVVDSTTPLPAGVMVCGHGLPGFGGVRNPGCTSPNDKSSMWKVQLDAPLPGVGKIAICACADLATPANWANHIVLRNIEGTLAPGSAQSGVGVHAALIFSAKTNVTGVTPPATPINATHVGLDRYYFHGWDPGDPGQPAGACSAWTKSGTVTTVDNLDGTSTVNWASGKYFGMTFTVGSTIKINSIPYTISDATLVQTGQSSVTLKISGSITNSSPVAYTESNPPAQYANGCGDDLEAAVVFNCDYCWRQNGYIEKVHWWASESHASSQGFDSGPYKDVNNWEEGGACTWFSGGGPTDTQGGPGNDMEVRRNYFGRDLNYRQLTGGAGNSPAPPYGCGPIDHNSGHDTCPFNYAIKNSIEAKIGHRMLMDGNVIENVWSDAQAGFCILFNARTCSGGQACGVYDSVTGLPKNAIDSIRFTNNWIRNCPQTIQMSNRSGIPGDGGGLSLPVKNEDYVNNLFTNVGDQNQFGNPGDNWQWVSGSNNYPCNMTHVSTLVTANCLPQQVDITSKISKIASVGNTVTITYTQARLDPMLCGPNGTGTPSVCIAAGQSVILSGYPGWNGVFAMTGTAGMFSGYTDGTGGSNIVYTDNINAHGTGTLCATLAACGTGGVVFSSLGYKMTDMLVGDNVYASDNTKAAVVSNVAATSTVATYTLADGPYTETNNLFVGQAISVSKLKVANAALNCTVCTVASVIGSSPQTGFTVSGSYTPIASNPDAGRFDDNTCSVNGYAVGATSSTYAAVGTITTGLTVVYTAPPTPVTATARCIISNGAGYPKNATIQSNTILSPNLFAITNFDPFWQPSSNQFVNNVFNLNDPGHNSSVTCTNHAGGTSAFVCWDALTFEFFKNVMTGQIGSNWSVADPLGLCPGCLNYFPNTVDCATNTPSPSCLGYVGFMNTGASPRFPTGSCPNSGGFAPFNCPLMALPWANNLTLADLAYVGTSSYQTQGVNTTLMNTAMTNNLYTCVGFCGDGTANHHPYPDSGGGSTPSAPIAFPAVVTFAKAPKLGIDNDTLQATVK